MSRYSFIVPVYNTEQYLKKCLDSLVKQTVKDYEIIIVNDGTKDNSQTIINEYSRKYDRIKAYKKSNGGLSDARNYGIKKATGDYLIFVDSDDYVDINMLKELNNVIDDNKEVDIVKFNYNNVIDDVNSPVTDSYDLFNTNGVLAFSKMVTMNKPFEMAWLYAYNRKYWLNNGFSFPLKRYHEDFGLIPLVILKSKHFFTIDNQLYYYVQRNNSIMTTKNYETTVKKAYDMLYHFDYLFTKIGKDNSIDINTKHLFNSYIANAIIEKTRTLNDDDRKKYIDELKKRHVASLVVSNTPQRLLKKLILTLNIDWYLKLK